MPSRCKRLAIIRALKFAGGRWMDVWRSTFHLVLNTYIPKHDTSYKAGEILLKLRFESANRGHVVGEHFGGFRPDHGLPGSNPIKKKRASRRRGSAHAGQKSASRTSLLIPRSPFLDSFRLAGHASDLIWQSAEIPQGLRDSSDRYPAEGVGESLHRLDQDQRRHGQPLRRDSL